MTTARPLPAPFARMHALARSQPWLGRFTLMNRLLLAMAFLPTGLVKATGQRFTALPIENPIGFFFEAMFRTGPYWVFLGLAQITAAVLLLIPATATLGAILFFPIGLSVFLITWGVGFQGTVWISGGMLLSAVYLLCWDADRIWTAAAHVLGRGTRMPLLEGANRIELAGWLLGGASGLALFMVTRSLIPRSLTPQLLAIAALAVLLVLSGWVIAAARSRTRGAAP